VQGSSPTPVSRPAQEPRPTQAQIHAARDAAAEHLGLVLGEAFPEGSTGWVGAARGAHGEDLVLKVAWAHEEARDEALGMTIWSRRSGIGPHPDPEEGASRAIVPRVLDARREGALSVLLMERVRPGATLARSGLAPAQEDEAVADLLTRLWIPADALPDAPGVPGVPDAASVLGAPDDPGAPDALTPSTAPPHGFRPLAHMCAWWADEAAGRLARDPRGLPSGLVRRGLDLFRALPRDSGVAEVLLATDLHHHNVLAAGDEGPLRAGSWRVIDPKPYVGDPHYDLLQHMLNDEHRLIEDPVGFSDRMARLTGLDPERAARWLLARCVQEAPGSDAAARAALCLAADGF
jgi:streptomycin 6-kinase